MYSFHDYFDEAGREMPYREERVELEDYLRLLDMVLERCLEFKGLNKQKKLFSRGLVITEAEMENYFSMPPRFRERDICDPELAEAAEEAWSYIDDRVALTLGLSAVLSGNDEDAGEDAEDDPSGIPAGLEDLLSGEKLPDGVPSENGSPEQYDGPEDASEEIPEDASGETLEGAPEDASQEAYGDAEGPVEIGIFWMESLRSIFALDRAGVMAVLLALSYEIDRRYERVYGFLQDDIAKTKPTVGLLAALMGRMTMRDGAEEMPFLPLDEELFSSLFVRSGRSVGLDTPLVLNPLMKRILLGLPERGEMLPDALQIYEEEPDIPLFFRESAEELSSVLSDEDCRFCYMESRDEETVLHLMNLYCRERSVLLYVLDLRRLMDQSAEEREACLSELSLRLKLGGGEVCVRLVRNEELEKSTGKDHSDRRRKLLNDISAACGRSCVVIFGEEQEPGELIVRAVPFIRVPAPDVTVRTEIWSHFLKDDGRFSTAEDVVIPDLADCYNISYGTIRNTCSHVKAAAGIRRTGVIDREMVLDSLRQLNQVDFSGLASYVRAAYDWDDITITDDQRNVLRVACDRYRLRNRIGKGWGLTRKNAYGNGVSLLLYGPPGTGKTMAAQVVAKELGLPLYRVDISQIFSKYVGETEKNLSVIFDAAKGANVILFFDEADALFSKRTEINNANDKYSNSETAFLLQKIEEYDGMSLLATNHYTNFDTAFVRRITYSVRLDSPDKEARYTLWTTILPEQTKVEKDVDFRFLADHFELSGANIKAILYSAAYMAGAQGKAVGAEHIVRAMEYEFRKLGRFIDRDAFGKYAAYLEQ